MSTYLAISLTVVAVPRRDILHTCSACPTSDANRFDRLKNGGGHNKTRSLEYHVEKTHPNHKGDFEDLKGTPVYKHRLISRPVPKTTTVPKTATKAAKNKKSSKAASG